MATTGTSTTVSWISSTPSRRLGRSRSTSSRPTTFPSRWHEPRDDGPFRAARPGRWERQLFYDVARGLDWGALQVRMQGALDARAALDRGERRAGFALRQSLIDVISCATCMAETMPGP